MTRIVVAFSLLLPLTAFAQQQPAPQDRLFLPVDSDAESTLRRLEELGARGQWDRVVTGLDKLLASGGDRLLKSGDGFRSVRQEARRRLLALTGEGRRAYDLVHADVARGLLAQGRASQDLGPLEELVTLHPAAREVPRARRLLVSRLIERGNPSAALPHLEALALGQLDVRERARVDRQRVLALALAGRRGQALNALEALSGEPASRDSLRRSVEALERPAAPAPADPSALAWSQEVFGYYEVTAQGSRPWSQPRADVATAYLHDGSHAIAVELESGKLRWRTSLRNQDAFERPAGLCALALAPGIVLCTLPKNQGLVALDRQSGRMLWTRPLQALVSDAEVAFAAGLAASAPPVVVGGVAVMAIVTEHQDREVHLLGVDLRSGDLAWSAFLASESGGKAPVPALAAAGDRLYAVTGHGAAAALDARGEILWLRRYASTRDKKPKRNRRMPFRPRPLPPEDNREDPSLGAKSPGVIVHQGIMWTAPADADGVFAFDTERGEERAHVLASQEPRLLAARGEGVLVLTKAGYVLAVNRAEQRRLGVLAGTLDADTAVVGETLFAGAAGGVLAFDLGSGTLTVATSWERSRGPGHLLSHGGRLLVAAPRGLYAFGKAPPAAGGLEPEAALGALGAPEFSVREAASEQLLAQREAAREGLLEAVGSRDPEVSLRAKRVLGELDRVARVERWKPLVQASWERQVPDLLNRLTHPNPEVRLDALNAMGAIPEDPAVVTLLEDLLGDADGRIGFTAAASLFERDNRKGLDLLRAGLTTSLMPKDRLRAAELFAERGVAEDLGALAQALEDPSGDVRGVAVRGVLRLHKGAEGGPQALEKALALVEDEQPAVRLAVLKACAEFDVQADQAWEAFTKAATDPDAQIRRQAITVVAELDSPEAYRVLGLALGDAVRETAKLAARKLYSVSQDKTRVLMIPAEGLEAGSKQASEHQRNYVSQIALRFVDSGGVLSVPTLTRFASDSNLQIRGYRIGGRGWGALLEARVGATSCDAAALEALSDLTLEKDPKLRAVGYRALGAALDLKGPGALLAQGLADEDAEIRKANAERLVDPKSGESLLDPASARAVLEVAVRATREEGRQAAQVLLARTPAELLFPNLVPLFSGDDADLQAEAALRLANASGGALAYTAGQDLRAFGRAAATWWWVQSHPGLTPQQLLVDLQDANPSTRWRAAQDAAELPIPSVRNALVVSLEGEEQVWVLKEKLKALVRVSGQELGFHDRLSPAELAACAERFKTWLSRRIAAEAGGERK